MLEVALERRCPEPTAQRVPENVDTLPIAYLDRPEYRILVVGGTLVAAAVIVDQLGAADSIVLLGIELDLNWPDENPTDDPGRVENPAGRS